MQKTIYRVAAALTIDGKIALNSRQFTNWSSSEDKLIFRKMLDESDVIISGHNTYKVSKRFLDRRNCIVFTRSVKDTLRYKKTILFCNPKNVDVQRLIQRLDYRAVTIIGGAPTFSYFLDKDLLDELHLTIEPIIFGRGILLFQDVKIDVVNLKLTKAKKLNKKGSLYLVYKKI